MKDFELVIIGAGVAGLTAAASGALPAGAAISGPLSFGGPFSILCALSLVSLVIGPFAAAASLRHGLD